MIKNPNAGITADMTLEQASKKYSATPIAETAEMSIFEDDNGNVVAKNKITGKTIWTAKGLAKTKSHGTTINLPSVGLTTFYKQDGSSFDAVQLDDKATGMTTFKDPSTGLSINPYAMGASKTKPEKKSLVEQYLGE
jgi:hypothetical protein